MAEFTKVATTQELPPGKMKEYRLGDKVVVVANSDGDYFAFAWLVFRPDSQIFQMSDC